jgi:hypothetical protein
VRLRQATKELSEPAERGSKDPGFGGGPLLKISKANIGGWGI